MLLRKNGPRRSQRIMYPRLYDDFEHVQFFFAISIVIASPLHCVDIRRGCSAWRSGHHAARKWPCFAAGEDLAHARMLGNMVSKQSWPRTDNLWARSAIRSTRGTQQMHMLGCHHIEFLVTNASGTNLANIINSCSSQHLLEPEHALEAHARREMRAGWVTVRTACDILWLRSGGRANSPHTFPAARLRRFSLASSNLIGRKSAVQHGNLRGRAMLCARNPIRVFKFAFARPGRWLPFRLSIPVRNSRNLARVSFSCPSGSD